MYDPTHHQRYDERDQRDQRGNRRSSAYDDDEEDPENNRGSGHRRYAFHEHDQDPSSIRHQEQKHDISHHRSLISQEEELLPGLLYVALAGVTGSLVARQSKTK